MNDAQALFAKVYENAQGAAGAGAGPDMSGMGPDMGAAGASGTSNTSGGDDVVDGDYREV